MRQVLIRTAFKGVIVLVGILLISTGLQLMIRIYGAEQFIELTGSQVSEAYPAPGRDEVISEEELKRVYEYFNGPFIPDPWPFDNESLWVRTEPVSR
jgi:hypothetical protein